MRDVSESKLGNQKTRSDGVVLGTLLQGTRGILLIVFNWTLFVQFDRMTSIPGVDVMAILPPSIFFLIGFMDIFMAKWVWRNNLNGWRYGIAMSMIIPLVTLVRSVSLRILTPHYAGILIILSNLFAVAEIIALVTPSARQSVGT